MVGVTRLSAPEMISSTPLSRSDARPDSAWEEDGSEDAIEEDGAAEEDGATLDEGDSFLREVHAAMETIKASAKAVETNAFIGYFLSK